MSEIAAVKDALDDLRRSIATYDDVHDLLDEGEEFDCLSFEAIGWNSAVARPSYDYWLGYYEARIINLAREFLCALIPPPAEGR